MKQCDWCSAFFKPAVSYQVYCTTNCRDEATKEKIAERHKFLKRQRRMDKIRMCAGKCGTRLSMYNDDSMCTSCSINKKEVNRKIREIKALMHEYEDDTGS